MELNGQKSISEETLKTDIEVYSRPIFVPKASTEASLMGLQNSLEICFKRHLLIFSVYSVSTIRLLQWITDIQCPACVSIQAVSILHPRPRWIFKNFLIKFLATYPSYKKYFFKFHHRLMVKDLKFQIYIEKMLKRPHSLFLQKGL